MEYIFGQGMRNGIETETLKTMGKSHSQLSGYAHIVREYPDATITDVCRIVEHYRSDEDREGKCYDWYTIADHWRNVDRYTPVKDRTEEAAATATIAFVAMAESGTIDGVTAGEHATAFAKWQAGVGYKMGNIRRWAGDILYRCIQDHVSQSDWTPEAAPSLWARIADPAEEWPGWSQPVGAQDAYQTGDKVSFGGKHWTSTVDDNVWEPGVYGWEE